MAGPTVLFITIATSMSQQILENITQGISTLQSSVLHLEAKVENIENILKEHAEDIELIARTVQEHSIKFAELAAVMVTKSDLARSLEPLLFMLNKLVYLAQKKDDELALLSNRLRHVEKAAGLSS